MDNLFPILLFLCVCLVFGIITIIGLVFLIMDYWTKCVSKNLEADFKVNDLIENFAETCGRYEEVFDCDVALTVSFLTNAQKRKLYKQLLNSEINDWFMMEENGMSYREFLDNIDNYVGKVVEFTSRFKADGKTFKTERYVWDNKDFGEPDKDALIEIIEVKVIRDGNLNTSVKGIIGVK